MPLPLLRRILNNTPGTATDIDYDFQTLQTHVNAELIARDGSVAMTSPLVGVTAVADDQYVTLGQVTGTIPAGVIWAWTGDTSPDENNWALCDGSIQSSTDPKYAALYAVIGTKFGDPGGGNFNLPDFRGRGAVGYAAGGDPLFDTIGNSGGSRDSELLGHTHTSAAHTHTINHGHADSIAISSSGAHSHTGASLTVSGTAASVSGTDYLYVGTFAPTWSDGSVVNGTSGGAASFPSSFNDIANHTHSVSGTATGTIGTGSSAHTHTITGAVTDHSGPSGSGGTGDTGSTGAGVTLVDKNLQPYLVINHIIKL
jgi:microcystin-dependent protein